MSEAGKGGNLRVSSLSKSYASDDTTAPAVDGIDFEIEPGRFYTLLGPSGCGKTTTLRCVAGLERPDAGRIESGETVFSDSGARTFVPPHKRGIGMVFQSYAVWPHMTVMDNVAVPIRVSNPKIPKKQAVAQAEEALAVVELAKFAGRMATQLSGGQQQRLALARALARNPRLLLLDEPLSNLDAKLRASMRLEIRALQRRLGITTLYVTHDQTEALSMSNRIAVMSEGRIVQEASPRDIYLNPNSRFVAQFVGETNLLDATVVATGPGSVDVRTDGGVLTVDTATGLAVGDRVALSIRPENVFLRPDDAAGTGAAAGRNAVTAEVEHVVFLGEYAECRVRIGDASLQTRQHPALKVRRGDKVRAEIPPDLCTIIAGDQVTGLPGPSPQASKDQHAYT